MPEQFTPFVECPNCKKLLELDLRQCPKCRELISEEYATASAAVVTLNTIACSRAKHIEALDDFFPIVVLASAVYYLIEVTSQGRLSPFIYIIPLLGLVPLGTVVLWFLRFGRFELGDDQYLEVRADMKRSLKLWSVLFVAQLVGAIAVIKFHSPAFTEWAALSMTVEAHSQLSL